MWGSSDAWLVACDFNECVLIRSYKRVKGRSHTVEKRISSSYKTVKRRSHWLLLFPASPFPFPTVWHTVGKRKAIHPQNPNESACSHTNPMQPASHRGSHPCATSYAHAESCTTLQLADAEGCQRTGTRFGYPVRVSLTLNMLGFPYSGRDR